MEGFSPEEKAKMQQKRTLSDAELIKSGAKYTPDSEGEPVLEITEAQMCEIEGQDPNLEKFREWFRDIMDFGYKCENGVKPYHIPLEQEYVEGLRYSLKRFAKELSETDEKDLSDEASSLVEKLSALMKNSKPEKHYSGSDVYLGSYYSQELESEIHKIILSSGKVLKKFADKHSLSIRRYRDL